MSAPVPYTPYFQAGFCLLWLVFSPAVSGAACEPDTRTQAKMDTFLTRLPDKRQELLRQIIAQADNDNRKLLESKQTLTRELEAILVAGTFDERSYLDKSAKLGTIRAKMRSNLDDAVAYAASHFTQDERKVLIQMHLLWQTHCNLDKWSHDDEANDHHAAPR